MIKLLVVQHQVSFTLHGANDCKEERQTDPGCKRCLHLRCLQTNLTDSVTLGHLRGRAGVYFLYDHKTGKTGIKK